MSTTTLPFIDWLSSQLKRAGMLYAFGVPGGGSSLDLMQALYKQKIKPVVTSREDAAVIMAGVSGTLCSGPGMAFTTKGPGLTNAINGIASAALDRLPVLIVSETFDEKELAYLSHQVLEQSKLVSPLLLQGQGRELEPTQNSIMSWLDQPVQAPAIMFPSLSELKTPVPIKDHSNSRHEIGSADLLKAEMLIKKAQSPVVVVGLETVRSDCVSELREFVHTLGAPVLCTYMSKGIIADKDVHFAGLFTGGAIEQLCMDAADLIILIGLDPVELIRKPWAYTVPVLDLCEQVYNPHYLTPEERIVAPLSKTLRGLTQSVSSSSWDKKNIANFKAHFFSEMEKENVSGLSSTPVVKAIRDSFSKLPRLAVDAGAHMFSACAFWPATSPNDLLISNGLASMGFAVPAAIAAALHDPKRGAVAITGDGGFLMCLGELKTAAEIAANILIVIFNDGRLSLIDIKRTSRQMPDLGLSWAPPNFGDVAAGFGFKSWVVKESAELTHALNEAANESGPRLVDIRIDPSGYDKQLSVLRG